MSRNFGSPIERFLAGIVKDISGCWLWQRYVGPTGYGSFKVDGKAWRVHRFAYEQFVGPIPDESELDHLCRVRRCANPRHLELVTHQENMRRSALALRPTCMSGHAWTPENTAIRRSGARRCRACMRRYHRAYRARLAYTRANGMGKSLDRRAA